MMKQSGMMGPVRVMQFWLRFMLPPNDGPCSLTAPLDKDSFAELPDSALLFARLENGLNVQPAISHL